ncbi:hypothetical protein CEXT_253871 [Caerostris extrusa]|uniref:Uncharacterized protein n=1 Tax=Caerostris extrusa TaxID=172846 RepID=A0AAV4XE61_CAEEX|nr:hypothetical protein CEXT_253871 [Caerostris extrusa]
MLLMKSKESDKKTEEKRLLSQKRGAIFSTNATAKREREEKQFFSDNVFSRPELAIKGPSKSKWTLGGRNKDINRKGLPVLKTV